MFQGNTFSDGEKWRRKVSIHSLTMGLVSIHDTKSSTTVVQNAINNMKSNCQSSSSVVQTNNCDIHVSHCPGAKIQCGNSATQVVSCKIDDTASAFQKSLADAYGKTDQPGFIGPLIGVDVTQTSSSVKDMLQQEIDSSCSSEASVNQFLNSNYTCIDSSGIVGQFMNVADSQTQCAVSAMANLAQKAYAKAHSEDQKHNGEAIALIIAIVILGLGVVIAIIFGARAYFNSKNNKPLPVTSSAYAGPSSLASSPTSSLSSSPASSLSSGSTVSSTPASSLSSGAPVTPPTTIKAPGGGRRHYFL